MISYKWLVILSIKLTGIRLINVISLSKDYDDYLLYKIITTF